MAGCSPAAPERGPSEVGPTEPTFENLPTPSVLTLPVPQEWVGDDAVVQLRAADAVDAQEVAALEEVAMIGGTGPDGEQIMAALGTLTANGDILVQEVRHDPSTLELQPEVLSLRSVDGPELPVPVPTTDGVVRQIVHLDAEGQRLAWMETTSVDLYDLDWRIVTSLPGGEAHVVADWSDITAQSPPLVGAEVVPSIGDGWVAWNAPVPVEGEGSFGSGMRQAIMVADLDGADLRTLDLWSATHAASGGSLYVAVDPLHDPEAPPATYQIVQVSPSSSDTPSPVITGEMEEGARVSAVAADGDALAWIVSGPPDSSEPALLYAQDGDHRVVLEIPDPRGSTPLSLSDGRVGWGDGSAGEGTEYLLDIRDSTLLTLGTSPGRSQVTVAGDFVAWAQVAEDGRSSVVHLARLPR